MSDGECVNVVAVLSKELNHFYESGELDNLTIFRVNHCLTENVQLKNGKSFRVLILLHLCVLHKGTGK